MVLESFWLLAPVFHALEAIKIIATSAPRRLAHPHIQRQPGHHQRGRAELPGRQRLAQPERGGGHAFKVAAGTLVAASLAYLLMNIPELTYFVFTFPAVLLILVGFMLAMGRYRGYRLTELFRFKAFLKD